MAISKVFTIGLFGLSGTVIEVEADISAQLPNFILVGLPDAALSEATSRVRAACTNVGHSLPSQKVVVNLSPASVPKSGAGFDLAIAIAILSAMNVIPATATDGACFAGELGLNGDVRAVPGILPMTMSARTNGFSRMFVPAGNASEAALVEGIEVLPVPNLAAVIGHLRGIGALPAVEPAAFSAPKSTAELDLSQVLGQEAAVEALIVAAAGGHHISMIGAPGAGKTMLAERLPGILPQLSQEAALEVCAVESIASNGQTAFGLNPVPRFISPHHSSSMAALIGGGTGQPRPGAVSLAHNGVLFLDEALEFNSAALDSLREPLEAGKVTISRSAGVAVFPARFQLVMAANPCPCGLLGIPDRECRCSIQSIRRYSHRLSGPILDRIDIRITVRPVSLAASVGLGASGETSVEAAAKVLAARAAAAERLSGTGFALNAHLPGPVLRKRFKLPNNSLTDLDKMVAGGRSSMRGYDRCLRLAWTLADLDGVVSPKREHIQRAVALRGSDDFTVA